MIRLDLKKRSWGTPVLWVGAGHYAYSFWNRDHKNKLIVFERTLNPLNGLM